MSKERPIIFSAPMVRAILEGRKSMTRRIVKCREEIACLGTAADWNAGKLDERMPDWETWGPKSGAQVFVGKHGNIFSLNCPYGVPGDRLKVKEDICAKFVGHDAYISYAADGELVTDRGAVIPWGYRRKAISGRFMRPVYSRLTLEIASVRVERLQEIRERDAEREGMQTDPVEWDACYTDAFIRTWESIHGPGSWERNDWCWVIEFGRIA